MILTEQDILTTRYIDSGESDMFDQPYGQIFHTIPLLNLRHTTRYFKYEFPNFNINRLNPAMHFDNLFDLLIHF